MPALHKELRADEFGELRLLTPQKEFIYAPESLSCFSGGYGVGKSFCGCVKGLLLSQIFPGNEGMVGRYIGRDLEDTTIPLFFEVCPPSWIAKNGYNKQKNMVTLRNGSKIYFRHIHDANAKTASKSRRVGANLGWFFVDQMEELSREHHGGLVGRLRHPKALKKFGFGTANPNGRDWIQQMFFPKLPAITKGQLWGAQRHGNLLGIAGDSEVNRISKGGFVDDDYYDRMLSEFPADWIERYIHCSFDDFSGKIFKGYTPTSIHNIRPFPIPAHWNYVVGIDVGGNCPWAVVPGAIDDRGSVILTPGYHEAGSEAKIANVVRWIKENLPWDSGRCKFVIDPENKPVMIELQEYGIHCVPADKKVLPGVHRMMGYFNVNAVNHLPAWYLETQPEERMQKFANAGAPRIFVDERATVIRRELDEWIWDAKKPNTPLKTGEKRFDACLVGETLVTMADGSQKVISKIVENDYVLTRSGARRVEFAACSDSAANVWEVLFSNGSRLIGTGNHPVLTANRGWIGLDALRYSDIITVCPKVNLNVSTTGGDLPFIPVTHTPELTLREEIGSYITTSGLRTDAQFPKEWVSTTKIKTNLTTRLPIWNLSLQRNINAINIQKMFAKQLPPHLYGTVLSQEESGTFITGKKFGKNENQNHIGASSAKSDLQVAVIAELDSVPTIASRSGAELQDLMTSTSNAKSVSPIFALIGTLKNVPVLTNAEVVSSRKLSEQRSVYNITVEGDHEYFANGVLTHNCDALRYVLMARPQASELAPIEDKHSALRKVDPLSAQEWEALERRRAEYGQRKDGNYALREAMCDEVGDNGLWVPNGSTQNWEW